MGILIENLSFHYTGTPVLDQVNLEVKDGDYASLPVKTEVEKVHF